MVAVMVLATFIIFVLIDFYLQSRRPQPAKVVALTPEPGEMPFPMSVVAGFKLPAHLSYHPGHTWAMKESRQVVRIGLDDFAARLVGQLEEVELPARGRWLRQGERAWRLARGNHRFEMLSPIEGEVVEVNEEALRNPSVAHQDPYGAGWLVAVNAPAADSNLKNLLRGRLAQRWMEESVDALHTRISPAAGTRLQDGGRAIADVLGGVPESRWDKIVRDLFLA